MNGDKYKRTKFGSLPGDIPKWAKICMLERKEEFFLFPWQKITLKQIKVYRKEIAKKAKRRFRKKNKNLEMLLHIDV